MSKQIEDEVTEELETEEEEEELSEEELKAIQDLLSPNDGQVWTAETMVYHGSKTRSIVLNVDIDNDVAAALCSQIYKLTEEDPDAPITLHLNTLGGSVIDALAIYDTLKISTAPIIVIVAGACMSAGLIILAAGDLRLSTPNSTFFYHQPVMSGGDHITHETIKSTSEMYIWSVKKLDKIIRERSGLSRKHWKKDFQGRIAKNFSPQQALKYNLIDNILHYADKPQLLLETDNG